jgi:heme/copper-type cytochrome/quinol oxidase subunit 3
MSPEDALLTEGERRMLEHTVLVRHRLEEQYENLEHQHQTASTGMWVFLATEVMFFGTLFLALGVYRLLYGEAFERASEKLNWMIGGINTLVLLTSSLTMVLAVHSAALGRDRRREAVGRAGSAGQAVSGFLLGHDRLPCLARDDRHRGRARHRPSSS